MQQIWRFSFLQASLIGATTALLCSCYSSYIPNVVHAPLLDHANEVVVSGTVGPYYGLHVAYAVDSQWAITTSLNTLLSLSECDTCRAHYIDVGFGRYHRGDQSFQEWFGGVGFEDINLGEQELFNAHTTARNFYFHENYIKIFTEGDLGYTDGLASGGFAGRVSYLHNLRDFKESSVTIEPTLFGRVGRKIQFLMQLGSVQSLFDGMRSTPLVWNIGLSFRLF